MRLSLRGAIPIALVGIAAGALAGCGLFGGSTTSSRLDRQPVDRRPVHMLTAEQLARDFADNHIAADVKYKGKFLQVVGAVERVTTSNHGDCSINLTGITEVRPSSLVVKEIRCQFLAEHQEKTAGLTRSQKITVRGRCDGETNSVFIDLADCELIDAEADPSISVTADQLTREYAGNREEADKKYKDKQLLVEGTFIEFRDDLQPVAVLQGHDEKAVQPLRVEITFASEEKAGLAKLMKDERVRLKGECSGMYDNRVSLLFGVLVKK